MAPPDPDNIRSRLTALLAGRFDVGDLLGVGGYAAVFTARDLVLGREVAIKAFDASAAGLDPEAGLDQCLAEARLVATIEHPHIVPLFEVGCEAGLVFLVMRLFPEGSLARLLEREHRLSPELVAELGATVADALATAHKRGVIHLDIKPDNILLDADGRAAVTDFGIAQAVGQVGDGNVSAGTPHYMSPEHVSGDTLDGRADVYALGVVLYEAAAGQTPIGGATAQQVMANQIRQEVPPLAKVVDGFPTALSVVIERALAKDPDQRWPGVAEMAAALKALVGSDAMLSPAELAKRRRRRWYKRAAVGCGLVTLTVTGVIWLGVRAFKMVTGGPPAAVDAFGAAIPPALVDSARILGLLEEGDTVHYLFVPAEGGMAEATVVGTTHLSRVYRGEVRRWLLDADDQYNMALRNRDAYFIIASADGSRSDTLYHTLQGKELNTLRSAMTQVFRERAAAAADSTGR